ncbi:phage major capsid protein [Tabrizicola sp.]|uniref:phage major capsid protein n=1 Tax=Tabrizicola sp. TaxID=2005166 RepID=UPI0035AF84DA
MSKHEKTAPGLRAAVAFAKDLERKNVDPQGMMEALQRKFTDHAAQMDALFEKTTVDVSGLKAHLMELEQMSVRGGGGGIPHVETWGEQFTKQATDQLESMVRDKNAKASVQLKALSTDGASGGALIPVHREANINPLPQQRLTIRALLPVVSVSSGTIEYVSQTTRTNAAAPVAEAATKPESNLAFALESAQSRVIAHWIKSSRQVLEDAPQLQSLIDTEMRYGLALSEEAQLLNGDGTGQNLDGLVTNATAFTDAAGIVAEVSPAGATMIDVIGAAIYQSAINDFPPTGIVLHWSDWWKMLMTKDSDGKYILGSPQGMAMPQMWGLPVVPTKSMAQGEFLVGDFRTAATLYDRWQPRIEMGHVNDDFIKNMVTILAEERVALAIKNPLALITGTFADALGL